MHAPRACTSGGGTPGKAQACERRQALHSRLHPQPTCLAAPPFKSHSTHLPPQVRVELYDRKQTKFISAHTGPLSCLTLSLDGKRLATTSSKGTLIRVWNTADGQLLQVGVTAGVYGRARGQRGVEGSPWGRPWEAASSQR